MADLKRLEKGFDRLAPVYDLLVKLFAGSAIPRSQTVFLEAVQGPRILVVGGGTGLFLEALLRSLVNRKDDSPVHVVNLDLSSAMLQRAAGRLQDLTLPAAFKVEHRHGGLHDLGPSERFDLICTHCFLDLFEGATLAAVMERLDQALVPGGQWMFSDFHSRRSLQVRILYRFFGVVCGLEVRRLADFHKRFLGLGYQQECEEKFLGGLLRSALYNRLTGR